MKLLHFFNPIDSYDNDNKTKTPYLWHYLRSNGISIPNFSTIRFFVGAFIGLHHDQIV